MTKNELKIMAENALAEFSGTFMQLDEQKAFEKPGDKWSAAEQLQHLNLSVRPLKLAFTLPGFALRWLFGKANRESRTYDEIRSAYKARLADGAKSSKPYIPKPIKTGRNKIQLVENFNKTHRQFILKFNTWSETQLDTYILPHPLLGKITLREMICFTIIHIHHHNESIKN